MALIFRHLSTLRQHIQFGSRWMQSSQAGIHTTTRQLGVFEPDETNEGPDIPEYEALKVQMTGHDYVLLESYAKYVHNLAQSLEIETEGWAVPSKTTKVQLFKPVSTTVEMEYDLSLYERAVQLQDLPSTLLPVFLEVARTNLPEGITLTIKEPDVDEEELRYIPDKDLMELHDQIETIDKMREERRKK